MKTARRFASLAAVLLSAGCASMVEVPVDTPLQSKLDVSGFKNCVAHFARVQQRPSVQKVIAYEKQVQEAFARAA